MYYVDENIKNCVRIFPEQGRYDYHRFDMNENPVGLPSYFVDEVVKKITPEYLAIYPEPDRFINKYASLIGVKYENILTTNGSDMAIRYLLEVFCGKGHEVVTVTPSFEMYAVNCSILGLKHVGVPYNDDLSIDIDSIVDTINDNTDIVVLLNPNNPVGNVYSDEEFAKIADKAASCNAIVIVDEAYHYFYKNTFLKQALNRDNVVILRTFSKMFSLAAVRLGIIISNPKLIGYVRKSRLTFDVNALALLFGEALVDHPEVIDELIRKADEGKDYLLERFKNEGYEIRDCKGNFVFIVPHTPPKELEQKLKDNRKILVKTYGNPLLSKYIRLSTGDVESMKFLADALIGEDNE